MFDFSVSINSLFRELPFLDRISAAESFGFSAIEIQFFESSVERIKAKIDASGLQVALINADMGDILSGGYGLSGVPGREHEFKMSIKEALIKSEKLGSKFLHVGPSRIPGYSNRQKCIDTFVGNIESLLRCGIFSEYGVIPLIEPINKIDAPDILFSNTNEVSDLIRNEFGGEVGLQFDIYHSSMSGRDVVDEINNNMDVIKHIQFSDAPGRSEPGTGMIDFCRVFEAIRSNSYKGFVGAEYKPSIITEKTLSWMKGF